MQANPHLFRLESTFPLQALALLCSICVICGATMSRPEGLHPPSQSDTHATPQHQHQEARPRGALVLLLGYDLANSPLLSSFISIALADSLATLALFLPFLFLPDLAKSSGIEADKVAGFQRKSIASLSGGMACICSGAEQLFGQVRDGPLGGYQDQMVVALLSCPEQLNR